jgi:sensor histidine kinase YesM
MKVPAIREPMSEKLRKTGTVILASVGIGLLYYIYLHFSERGSFPTIPQNTAGFFVSIVAGLMVGFSFVYANQFLDKVISWTKSFAGRFILGYVAQVIISLLLISGVGLLAVYSLGNNVFWENFDSNDPDVFWKLTILTLVTSFIYNVVYSLLYSYKQYAVTQIESIQSERKQLELQFEALKGQISPHYLFNSLNTISSLIYKDPQSAEQFVRRLAQTYQYILSTQSKKYVTLAEEIDFVQSYYYLLKIRFQQALTVEINLPASIMASQIPPLTLQMLVENAVKHNSINPDNPMFIYISALDNTQLRISNTKNEPKELAPSFKIGLENIKKRYEFFTDRKIEITDADKFMVSLPILLAKTTGSSHKISA